MHPRGVRISSFKAPTARERRHGFLWRVRRALPPPGFIGVFNRSHYEDVLVDLVHGLRPSSEIARRYGKINRFESELIASGTAVVKIYLHISYEEQRRRLLERIQRPEKRWKFSQNDLTERAHWNDYQRAYDAAFKSCGGAAPWFVVPADDKRYRNWAVSQILFETLAEIAPEFPRPDIDFASVERRLWSIEPDRAPATPER
jgi:PPK2 family polyphosphate:nucleotide phosphotransferase